MINERFTYRDNVVKASGMPVATSSLTVPEKTSYAKVKEIYMASTDSTAETESVLTPEEREKGKAEEKKESKLLEEFGKHVDTLKTALESKRLEKKDLLQAYFTLHHELHGVKVRTSPREYIKALIRAKFCEVLLKAQLAQHKIDTADLRKEINRGETAATSEKGKEVAEKERQARKLALRGAWHRHFSAEELRGKDTREAINAAVENDELPDDSAVTKRLLDNAEEILENAKLPDKERFEKAEDILSEESKSVVSLSPQQEKAILAAHRYSEKEVGKDGDKAGVFNLTREQVREKYRILRRDGVFTAEEAKALLRAGIAGGVGEEPAEEGESEKTTQLPNRSEGDLPSPGGPSSREELWKQMESTLGEAKLREIFQSGYDNMTKLYKSDGLIDWADRNPGSANIDEARTRQVIQDMRAPEPINLATRGQAIRERRHGEARTGNQFLRPVDGAGAQSITSEPEQLDFPQLARRIQEPRYQEAKMLGETKYTNLNGVIEHADDPDADVGGIYTPQERQHWRNYILQVQAMPEPSIHALNTALEYIGNLAREDPTAFEEARRELSIQLQEKGAEERAINMLVEQGWRREEITPEQIDLMIEQSRPMQSIPAQIEKRKEEILRTNDLETARNNFAWLRRYVNDVYESVQRRTLIVTDETRSVLEQVRRLNDADLSSVDVIRQWTNRLTDPDGVNIKKFFNRVDSAERRGRGRLMVQSLEDLVELISESQGGEFAPGKKFAVINERGEVQLHNLVAWIRNRILFLHSSDPDNAIQPLSQISVPTFYGQINLMSMLSVPAYFQKRQVVIEGDEREGGGGIRMRVENVEDKDYNQFKDDLLYEAWLFGVSHSNDWLYREKREREDEIFNVIASIYAKNEFTKGQDRLLNILGLAKSDDPEQMKSHLNERKQGSVGKAIARSIMAYYYLAELVAKEPANPLRPKEDELPRSENMFVKNFGEEGMKYFYQSIIEQLLKAQFGNEIESNEAYEAEGRTEAEQEMNAVKVALMRRGELDTLRDIIAAKGITGISREDLDKYHSADAKAVEDLALKLLGKLWTDEEGKPAEKKDLNIFNTVTKPERITTLVRNAITATSGRLEGLTGDDINYAGTWAFTMRNWTGIAAKNDTTAIGFDAWSKLINFQEYRVRQASGREGGGNLETLWGIRSLGLTFLDGLIVTTESGERKSLAKVIQESVQNTRDIEAFTAPGNGQRQFAGNHVGRGYQLMEFILDKVEMKMDQFITIDRFGNVVFDHVKAQELMGGPYKYMRYAFDQLNFPMEDTIRGWYIKYETNPKTGKLEKTYKYGDREMKHYFFSDDVLKMGMYNDDYYESRRREGNVARNVFAYLLANELKVHRRWGSTYPRWNIETIEEIEHFFAQFSQEPGIKIENGKTVPIISRSFFTKHEWDLILKAFNSPYWKMYTEEWLIQSSLGFGGAFLKAFVELLKQVIQLPKAA